MGARNRRRQQKTRPGNVTDPHHLEAGLDPDSTKQSSTSLTLRRRTYRIGGLVAATTAVKAAALLAAAFYLFGGALLFCVLCLGCGVVLIEFAAAGATFPNPRTKMWTLAQFETFGALRLDAYVRYLVTKLAVVWRTIAAIHKSAVNYSFTVSIAETPSLLELENLLDGRIPLLAYEGVTTEDEWSRSRGASLASSICDQDTTVDPATESESEEEKVYYSIDIDPEDAESGDEGDYESEVEEEPETVELAKEVEVPCAVEVEVEDEPQPTVDPVELKKLETQVKATVAALRLVAIPLVPLAQLLPSYTSATSQRTPTLLLEPLLVPSIKPLIAGAPQKQWTVATPKPAPVQAPPVLKRRISVSVAAAKPTTRLVVKPRPSTLTPPQSVQRMLEQAESMLRELNALLAAGNELLHPSEPSPRKSVRFCDEVDLIDVAVADDASTDSDATASLFYGSDEIECMSAEYFASMSVGAC